MKLYFAPMEGVTTAAFRQVHARIFGGADRYYAPFISPTSDHLFTPRELRELAPENNPGITLIPQLLTKSAEDFLWAAHGLRDMCYQEIDLNLGCPSATVTAKGKGSGLLRTRDALERMLDEIFSRAEIAVSIKTRLGYAAPEEFYALLELFNRYPVAELILHARTRNELYAGPVHREMYDYALAHSAAPVCYNGDLLTPEDCADFADKYGPDRPVMAGRGPARDPAYFRRCRGGKSASREELMQLHEELYETYRREYGAVNGMRRMKELWSYLLDGFADSAAIRKRMFRTKDVGVFEDCVAAAFRELPLKTDGLGAGGRY